MIYITFSILLIGIYIFVRTSLTYNNLFNPLSFFILIWALVPFLYSLQLSKLLKPLAFQTYFWIYISAFFYLLGVCLVRKKSYKERDPIVIDNNNYKKRKVLFFYLFFFILTIIEIRIKTPPLLSSNPFRAYMDPDGIGVHFFHFAVIMLPVSYIFILIHRSFKKVIKLILFIPPLIILILWMQRGIIIWYLILVLFIVIGNYTLKKQIKFFIISFFLIIVLISVLGNLRTYGNAQTGGKKFSMANLAQTPSLPSYLAWPYIYLTASLQNINQTLEHEDIQFLYGFDIIQPVLSLMQIKNMDKYLFDERKEYFKTIGGFNVPTYLYWIFINFGYIGFVLIPFILGIVFQKLYNGYTNSNLFSFVIYTYMFPYLMQSFHDFFFWNVAIILIVIFIYFYKYRIKIGNFYIY